MNLGNDLTPDGRGSIEDDAAFWDARLRSPECTVEDRLRFAAWRDKDPRHAEAFEHLQSGLKLLHEAYATSPELRRFRDEALGLRRPPSRFLGPALAAGLAAATIGAGLWLSPVWRQASSSTSAAPVASVYQTTVGERTTVELSDGSRVTLNTHSRVEVAYTPERRNVRLVSGQALFVVAKNKARPFVVSAGPKQVTAVGTAFDVRLDPSAVQVTMVEGKVRVGGERGVGAAPEPERDLVAGERLTARADGAVSIAHIDPRTATGWSEGRVLFEDTPLPEAMEEINRYLPAPVRIVDPQLASIRINGMFRTDQPMSFVRALTSYLPVELRTDATGPVLAARPISKH